MKVSYFGYCLSGPGQQRQLYDLRPFVRAFSTSENVAVHSQVTHRGEHLFLKPTVVQDAYLFLMTKDQEIIKHINMADLSVADIHEALQRNSCVSFASYVYLDAHFFAIATTILAPKANVFSLFLEQLFRLAGDDNLLLNHQSFHRQLAKREALDLPMIGRTTLEVEMDNGLFEQLRGVINVDRDDVRNIRAFRIEIIPQRRKDITRTARHLIADTDLHGIEKFQFRAREALDEQLQDFYLTENGVLGDFIDRHDMTDRDIIRAVVENARTNERLQVELGKFTDDTQQRFQADLDISRLDRFGNDAAWADLPAG